jgi:hypothetical protein
MPNLEGLQRDLAFVQKLDLVDKKLRAEQVIDLSFLKAAQAKVGMYKRSE